jgi:hypothetical protein
MLIQLTTPRVGPTCNDTDGDVIDVPADEAGRLIAGGQAVPFHDAGETDDAEAAVLLPVAERAVLDPKPKPKKRSGPHAA